MTAHLHRQNQVAHALRSRDFWLASLSIDFPIHFARRAHEYPVTLITEWCVVYPCVCTLLYALPSHLSFFLLPPSSPLTPPPLFFVLPPPLFFLIFLLLFLLLLLFFIFSSSSSLSSSSSSSPSPLLLHLPLHLLLLHLPLHLPPLLPPHLPPHLSPPPPPPQLLCLLLLTFSSYSSSASSCFLSSPHFLSHPPCTIIGAHPISRLDVIDSRIPIDISVYAYPRYRFNDMNTSATPAVAFTAVIRNSLSESVDASFLFNLPLGMEPHTLRLQEQMSPSPRNSTKKQHLALTAQECFEFCNRDDSCLSWTYEVSNYKCLLFDDVRMNGHHDGFVAGIKVLVVYSIVLYVPLPLPPSPSLLLFSPSLLPSLPPFLLPSSLPSSLPLPPPPPPPPPTPTPPPSLHPSILPFLPPSVPPSTHPSLPPGRVVSC